MDKETFSYWLIQTNFDIHKIGICKPAQKRAITLVKLQFVEQNCMEIPDILQN